MAHYATGVFFMGDENDMEGPEYLYNTAPFWVSLTVLSCGAGAVMYTEPVWLGATSDPYTPVQWDLLATTSPWAVHRSLLGGTHQSSLTRRPSTRLASPAAADPARLLERTTRPRCSASGVSASASSSMASASRELIWLRS